MVSTSQLLITDSDLIMKVVVVLVAVWLPLSHIALALLWKFLLCWLIVNYSADCTCLFVGEHIRSINAGSHDALFVATNSDCVHMVLGALQR